MSEMPMLPSVLQEQNHTSWTEFAAWFVILICAALLANIAYPVISQYDTDEKYMFEKIAEHVADDYEYSAHIFDCSEFSDELYNRLVFAGYEHVRIEAGCKPDSNNTLTADYDACHAWVVLTLGNEELFIESTTGEVKRKPYYRKKFPFMIHIIKSSEVVEWESA